MLKCVLKLNISNEITIFSNNFMHFICNKYLIFEGLKTAKRLVHSSFTVEVLEKLSIWLWRYSSLQLWWGMIQYYRVSIMQDSFISSVYADLQSIGVVILSNHSFNLFNSLCVPCHFNYHNISKIHLEHIKRLLIK